MPSSVDETIESLVVRYEARHGLRCLYLAATVFDPMERYQREQNSIRTLRHELATVARQFHFDPSTGRYLRNGLGVPVVSA